MIIRIFTSFLLLYTSALYAAEYSQTGVISEQANGSGVIIISDNTYLIDNSTTLHGIFPIGEIGPVISEGTAVGFNTVRRPS
ncbi:MAG TPA: hypothetical protein ENI26_09800, partial [Methylophaga aminisulfidivorans]|nr:hypothetical protein [Methylophaga aminisulfidivorans]